MVHTDVGNHLSSVFAQLPPLRDGESGARNIPNTSIVYVLLLVLVVSEKSVNYLFKFYLSLFFFITLPCVKNDPCYTKPHLHVFAYVINWTSVVVNPVIYVVMQRSYQVSITLFLNKFQNFSL